MKKHLNDYEKICDQIIAKCSRSKDFDERLILSKSNKTMQIYRTFKDKGSSKRGKTYIKKSEEQELRRIAQGYYEKQLLKQALRGKRKILRCPDTFDVFEFDQVLEGFPKEILEYITPVIPTYKLLVEEWLSIPYERLPFGPNDREIYTLSGIRVRSKSERDLIHMFEREGIAFKYEAPIWINGISYRPDFTFLCPYTGREIYWEHLGSVDDPAYMVKSMEKIRKYINAGLKLGDRLIITWEDGIHALDVDLAYKYIDEKLKAKRV